MMQMKCGKWIAALLLGILLGGCSEDPDSWPRQPFNAGEWAKTEEANRYVFVKDLVDSQRLIGIGTSEVKLLLGPPSYESAPEHYFNYFIKRGSSGFDRLYYLDIRTNPSTGVVESVSIRGD
jgi:hypothetical protein